MKIGLHLRTSYHGNSVTACRGAATWTARGHPLRHLMLRDMQNNGPLLHRLFVFVQFRVWAEVQTSLKTVCGPGDDYMCCIRLQQYGKTLNYTGPSQITVKSVILTLLRRCSDNLRTHNKDNYEGGS